MKRAASDLARLVIYHEPQTGRRPNGSGGHHGDVGKGDEAELVGVGVGVGVG